VRGAATVGGYQLLNRIGEGGMGVVHLAQAPDGRRVALKVLRPNIIGDDESRQRLAQEVDSLQHVRSRHVAEILDADPWGDVPFVVTRFVPGESLHTVVEEDGPLPEDDLVHVARGLLGAVRDVHAVQVLHRDIKPTNVVMEGRSPILIDFGLARLAEDPRLTATGSLMGSPGYLAPEVLFGLPATPATDVHGWAATLVYAATGHSPYGHGHVMTVLDRTRRGTVDLEGVPHRLRSLLLAALATEPHERPTVQEALGQLDALDGSVVSPSRPASWSQRRVHEAPPVEPTRSYTVVGLTGPPDDTVAPSAYPMPERLSGWARMRRALALLALAGVVVTCFGTAPYVTAAIVALGVLLARGLSHNREAMWRRRSTRGRRWFDGPLALLSYPWHLVRGSLGGLALLLAVGTATAATVAALALADVATTDALLVGGAVLAIGTWLGPGSARVREPVGRLAGGIARHSLVWWLVVTALVVVGGTAWWVGQEDGVRWDPAQEAPWGLVRDVADVVGIDASTL
jgi:predicted Ser/Thr protein kinase